MDDVKVLYNCVLTKCDCGVWNSGIQWFSGNVEQWNSVTVVQWISETVVQ